MYEQFGAVVNHQEKTVVFKLFIPDWEIDHNQYFKEYKIPNSQDVNTADKPDIRQIKVIGDFQSYVGGRNWDINTCIVMNDPVAYKSKGYLYETKKIKLADGFFQYKFVISFYNSDAIRWINDPCTKYHNYDDNGNDNSGFVIGGSIPAVEPIKNRLPIKDLLIYEMMIEDFAFEFKGNDSYINAIRKKIDYLDKLGINAVEFMPWTAWEGGKFNWGYMPFLFFAVTNRYTNQINTPLEKISQLKMLINELHKKKIHVIMDCVFNHVSDGFPYLQIYKDYESSSPYIGNFARKGYGREIDFYNTCTQDFFFDVCKYWIDVFKIDGIRFDFVTGIYNINDNIHGITGLINTLNKEYPVKQNRAFMLELLSDNRFEAIDHTNTIDANGCWFDSFMWNTFDFIKINNQVNKEIMRILNSAKDFKDEKFPVIYIENHDHSTLINQIGLNDDIKNRDQWERTRPYAIALFTSPGAVLLHNGQEYGESYWFPEEGDGRVWRRELRWKYASDAVGKSLNQLYSKLINIRKEYQALRSHNFSPVDEYGECFNAQGYGFHKDKQMVIYKREYLNEYFIIVINFSQFDQKVNIPFPCNGKWKDLLNDDSEYDILNFWLNNIQIKPNWGCIYYYKR